MDPDINFETDNAETIQEKYKTWINNCNRSEQTMAETIYNQLWLFIKYRETTIGSESITCYSVDSYLAEDIDIMLDNIFATTTEQMGVYAYDNAVFMYIIQNQTKLEEAFGDQIPSYGRFTYDDTNIVRNYNNGTYLEDKALSIRKEVFNQETNEMEYRYYVNIPGNFGNAFNRYKKWGDFTEMSSDVGLNSEYQKFYNYTLGLESQQPPEPPEPQPNIVTLTADTIFDSEYEIYECDQIYETFILNEKTLNVAPTSDKANEYLDMIINIPAVKALLDKVYEPKPVPEKYEISNVCLYKNPLYKSDEKVENANAILEYGQFLSTIQGMRNLIQQSGEEVLIKFTQTDRGTFFEILGKEPESSSVDVYEGAIAGFFISKGYQGKLAEGQHSEKPSIPRGRYDRKIRRSMIPVKPVTAAPDPKGENGEDWRITIIPKFYEGEPLDWTKDNYYTTFLFAQNADNLNIQIDPEFEARNKVIFTPGTTNNETDVTKRLEEQMIGYFVVTSSN